MKSQIRILLCGIALQASLSVCLAHDNKTMHPRISEGAAKSSTGLPNFLTDCFGYSLTQTNLFYSDPDGAKGGRSPLEWIKAGSYYEDVPWWRGNNHFYDPTKKPAIGLTDGVTLGYKPSSFVWATVEMNSTYRGILSEQRSYTWATARNFELNALTNSWQSGRETKTYSYQILVPDPYYVETITNNLESDDFGFPITAGNYEVMVNYAKFDDTGTIGSLTCQMSENPSCTLPDEITNAIVPIGDITITPDGQHLSVPVTATDDPACKLEVGWWTITITWRAWPAP